jgi:choline-sulfatase
MCAPPGGPISPRSRQDHILETLEACGFCDDTVVVFTSDHGDMLGERGLWFKMNFFEGSARVPLMIAAPGRWGGRAVDIPTSLLDVLPTLVDLAGGSVRDIPTPLDGRSLAGIAAGATEPGRRVVGEYAAEGSVAPMIMLRAGPLKYIHCEADPPLLFDVAQDPDELENRAADPRYAGLVERFAAAVADGWNLPAFTADVLASQARRRIVYEALRNGSYYPWDFQPLRAASERYMRNHMDLNVLEATSRFPPAPE